MDTTKFKGHLIVINIEKKSNKSNEFSFDQLNVTSYQLQQLFKRMNGAKKLGNSRYLSLRSITHFNQTHIYMQKCIKFIEKKN